MSRYANPKELLDRVSTLMREAGSVRSGIALRQCMALAYCNGRHWQDARVDRGTSATSVVSWDDDWNLKSNEMRVTDNRIGPLFRQIRASTNAAGVVAEVSRPEHDRGFERDEIARSAKLLLDGMSQPAAMTAAYRGASSLRWSTGSSLIVMRTVRRTSRVPGDVATHPDGSPVVVDDSWVRWRRAPISDLVWDPCNISGDLDDHEILVLEQAMTARAFEREFGPLAKWGLDEKRLPRMSSIVPHYITAANVAGSSIYGAYAAQSSTPALRILTVCEQSVDGAPGRFPCCWHIIDTTPAGAGTMEVSGIVVNWDNPYGQWGWNGRPFAKLDAFRRDDRVDGDGIPTLLAPANDMLNIARSIQFQQMVAVVHGHWIVDGRSVGSKEEFLAQLSNGIGGVLQFNSRDGTAPPPQFVHPPPPDQTWPIIAADIGQGMMSSVHQTQQSLGIAKTHVPSDVQMQLLQNSGAVIDQVVADDVEELSNLLGVTLGTMRRKFEQPGHALGHLRDQHGFDKDDLLNVLEIDPDTLGLVVRAEMSSIAGRSVAERRAEILAAMQIGQITPMQASLALADELGRPLIREHKEAAEFARSGVRFVVDGGDWPGVPSLDAKVFASMAKSAQYRLRMHHPDDVAIIARLETAMQVQNRLAPENQAMQSPQFAMAGGGAPNNAQTAGGSSGAQGAPGSIDPTSSPVGAAGGLPLGLPPSMA